MAEFAQLRKEKWSESLEALKELELFHNKDLRLLVRKINDFEYKIQSSNRTLADVLAYIQFECTLLKNIRRCKEVNQCDLTDDIDRFICLEILSQFGSAEINFKHRFDFWDAKLKFLAGVVTHHDLENEFNNTLKKALDSCCRFSFDFYKFAVNCQWWFLNLPQYVAENKRKRKKTQSRDPSKIMINVREVTRGALRDFPRHPEVYIWVFENELKYLSMLESKKESQLEKQTVLLFDIDIEEETEKTEKLVQVLYSSFSETFKNVIKPYFQLYEVCLPLSHIRQAISLRTQIKQKISIVRPKTTEIFSWLIDHASFSMENSVGKYLETMAEALSTISTIEMLDICITKVNCLLQQTLVSKQWTALPELIAFCSDLYSNKHWEELASEMFHVSRIHFLKHIQKYIRVLSKSSDMKTIAILESMYKAYPVDITVDRSLIIVPSCFGLLKELILRVVSTKERFTDANAKLVIRYLSVLDWTTVDSEEVRKLLNVVYYALITANVKVQVYLKTLLKISAIPAIDELRIHHLKNEYLKDVQKGRTFYDEFRLCTSSWKLACVVISVETDYCVSSGLYSDALNTAIEDSVRLGGTFSIEPWIIAILSNKRMNNERSAKQLTDRALKRFRTEKANTRTYQDLLLFSKQLG